MNELEFQNILKEKGIEVSEHQLQQFQKYYEILVEWNEKMNLTAITDKEDVYLKHFYDSITIAFDFDFNNQTLIDVGAGAGFPSVPLKILYPNLKITIVDSLNKRITFLNHLFKELELDNCQAVAASEDHRPVFTGITYCPIGFHSPQCHLIVVRYDEFDLFSVLADQTIHTVLRLSTVPVR